MLGRERTRSPRGRQYCQGDVVFDVNECLVGFKNAQIKSLMMLVFPSLPTNVNNDATVDREEFLTLAQTFALAGQTIFVDPREKGDDASDGGYFFVARPKFKTDPIVSD